MGEKLDQIEVFHPDRMASRILGMGDVLTLIEKATENIDETDAMKMAEKLQKGYFGYNDFLKQIRMIKRMGSMKSLLGLIPGLGAKLKNIEIDDKQFSYISRHRFHDRRRTAQSICLPTTAAVRNVVAKGSGRSYQEVNALTKRFDDMRNQIGALLGMSEEQMEKAARTGAVPNMMQPKVHKGKGKTRKPSLLLNKKCLGLFLGILLIH